MVKLPTGLAVLRKRHFFRALALFALVPGALSSGCRKDATQLVVLVNTDYDVPAELAFVVVRISELDGTEVSSTEFALTDTVDPADPTRFAVPFSFGVVPRNGDADRRIVVEVDGLGPMREVRLTRLAITGFVSQRTLLLPMFLAEGCEGITCTEENQTCTREGCVSAVLEPGSLREVLPGGELLDAGMGDGATPVACGADRCDCDAGYCDATCVASGRCDVLCSDLGCTVDAMGVNTLVFECAENASCVVDAQGASDVQADCLEGATCDLDCRGASSCFLECFGATTSCILHCTDGLACEMRTCEPGGMMTCADDVIVCNAECP